MSDTRNHTTRDQFAEVLYSVLVDHHVWIGDDGQPLDYSPEREARLGDLIHDLADALLASDAIAAVRAAAVEQAAQDFPLTPNITLTGVRICEMLHARAARLRADTGADQ